MTKYFLNKNIALKTERLDILVTGASGFIGRNLVEFLSTRTPHRIIALGRTDSDLSYIGLLPSEAQGRVRIVRSGLDTTNLSNANIHPNVIIHTAGKVSDYGRVEDFNAGNVEAARNLLEFARSLADLRSFIHFSTIDVYGYQDTVGIDEDTPADVGHNPYNTTKALGEEVVGQYKGSLPITILRPATVIGRYNQSLIVEAINMLKSGMFFYFRKGNRTAGLLDVRNLAGLIQQIILNPSRYSHQTFNVADNWHITWAQFIKDLGEETGYKKYLKIFLPYKLSLALGWLCEKIFLLLHIKSRPPITRLGVQLLGTHQEVSTEKLREAGYNPAYDYAASISDIALWLKQLGK